MSPPASTLQADWSRNATVPPLGLGYCGSVNEAAGLRISTPAYFKDSCAPQPSSPPLGGDA
jgi:hypothetical protein